MLRNFLFGLTALAALIVAGPAAAGDFDKYVPEDAQFYAHVNVPKLFASEMVRKAVPMAFDKYGDQLIMFAGMAKGMNPNMPDVPEEKMKEGLKQMADPKVIAQAFDVAGPVVTDIVVTGSMADGEPNVVIIIKCVFITPEGIAQIAGMAAGGMPGVPVKLETIKKAKGVIYAMDVPNAPEKVCITVPEAGILHICMGEEKAEKSFTAASKPTAKLADLIAKRNKDDFLFFAGLGTDDADYTSMVGNFTLDKDLGGKLTKTMKDEAAAKEEAKKMNDQFGETMEQLKGMLGEKAEVLKPHMEKSKATVDGKAVNGIISIPGTVVEKLLGKD
jgi:hypothetical protein